MTLDEINQISRLMDIFFGREARGDFLITNASLQDMVSEFTKRLRDEFKDDARQGRLLRVWIARASGARASLLAQTPALATYRDGTTSPVLTEASATLLSEICPPNFEDV